MHPYKSLPEKAFWRSAVARNSLFDIRGLWQPKFDVTPEMPIATFGSCFAQHFGHALRDRGFKWMDMEPAPRDLSSANAKKFNFGLFTCRTGNIYTTSLLLQWLKWALDIETPPEEYWEKDGRIYDPFRPNIEPNGFETVEEMLKMRQVTIEAMRLTMRRTGLFVFTLGLTESWVNAEGGYEYPMCPGTVAGDFDGDQHVFRNQSFEFISQSLKEAVALLQRVNPAIKILLTVSPVPLTATNSGEHVLVASSLSKSILRAVAGAVAETDNAIDYFPSYEIINSPVYKGVFFEPNLRQVNHAGVDFVMENFFHDLGAKFGDVAPPEAKDPVETPPESANTDAVCEEELLAAFGAPPDQNMP
jgi:hypothetical protein